MCTENELKEISFHNILFVLNMTRDLIVENCLIALCASVVCCHGYMQELEHRRKAERAAHAAMNGPKALAFEYAGPDYEVRFYVTTATTFLSVFGSILSTYVRRYITIVLICLVF